MEEQTGCDGIMVARGVQGNPWLFRDILALKKTGRVPEPPSAKERIQTALRHMHMLIETKAEKVAVCEMRKHISWYMKGLKEAGRIRRVINSITTASEMEEALLSYQEKLENTIQ